MYLVLYSEHCLQPVFVLEFFSLDVPHCLVKHMGAGLRGKAGNKWYVSWAMTIPRHTNLLLKIHYITRLLKSVPCKPT